MSARTVSETGVALTMQFEGCDLESYPDPGTRSDPWTVGWGHTGREVIKGMKITQAQADAWLRSDLAKAAACVNANVKVPLTQNQFDALCDLVFNIGAGNFVASTLLRLLNAGNYASAAVQFDRWNLAAGRVLPGLVKRRLAERQLFMKPDAH
jgi:lysozyme